jgi:hypothetical protein
MHAVAEKFCVFIRENFVHDGDTEEVLRKTIRPSNDLSIDDLPSGTSRATQQRVGKPAGYLFTERDQC